MLKEYLKNRNISIYLLSKKAMIPYSTLNDLCNCKVDIDNCKVSLLMRLAKALAIDIKYLYDLCKNKNIKIKIDNCDIIADLNIKNKCYYLEYSQNNNRISIPLFKVNAINSKYVKEGAEWVFEEKIMEYEMEKIYAIQSNAKK